MICLYHVWQLCREDVIATIFALSLACDRIDVLDGQVLVQNFWVELRLRRLSSLKVCNSRDFNVHLFSLASLLTFGLAAVRLLSALGLVGLLLIFVLLLVDQDVQVGEQLRLATSAQVRRRWPRCQVLHRYLPTSEQTLHIVGISRRVEFAFAKEISSLAYDR